MSERCSYYGGAASGGDEEPAEYYFFSYKDRKYPSGTRTNRATAAGFWKATGRDKPVLSSSSTSRSAALAGVGVIGMRKTLVFYRGRAPNGRKTDWIIHEYRLQNNEHAPAQEEGWVVCRAFQKPMPNQQQRHACYAAAAAAAAGYPAPGGYPTYYYMSGGAGGGGAPPPALLHADVHSNSSLLESKLQVQLLADIMPPLQSPAAIDAAAHSYDDHQSAAESSTVDWNLLSSLLPSAAQLNFHQPPPASSPSSCSKNHNEDL
jgi:hypothetical protein